MDGNYDSIPIDSLSDELSRILSRGWSVLEKSRMGMWVCLGTPEELYFHLFPSIKSWHLERSVSSGFISLPTHLTTVRSLTDYLETISFRSRVATEYLRVKGIIGAVIHDPDSWETNSILQRSIRKYKPWGIEEFAKKRLFNKRLTETEKKLLYDYITRTFPSGFFEKLRNVWFSLILNN